METGLIRLKKIHDEQAKQAELAARHADSQLSIIQLQETVVQAVQALMNYLDDPGRVTKTAVTNQLQEIGTPDALKVVSALEDLHETLRTHENTDLTQITAVMQAVLEEAKQIPKEHATIDIPDTIEVRNQIDYSERFSSLETAIKAIKLTAEAPKVDVRPEVNVDAPDLTPLHKGLDDVRKAVKAIVIPETKPTDIEPLVKQLKKTNKLLDEIADKPVGGGGGGGGRATPYEVNGIPAFVELENGGLPTVSKILTERYDYASSTVIYTAVAPVGTADASTGWTITKYDLSNSSDANGKIATDVSWDNRATGTYA